MTTDKRHLKRKKIVQELYSCFFSKDVNFSSLRPETVNIFEKSAEIDCYIDEFASRHGSDKIAKIDLAILRLAIYELLFEEHIPPKVSINEAVELAKDFGSEKSPSFVNAVLGQIYKKYGNIEYEIASNKGGDEV